jgi:hypothetical protein
MAKMALSLLALLGAASIIGLTSLYGIGMANDSRSYIGLARYFLNGSGQGSFLLNFFIVHFPPLFPFTLSLCSRLSGLDPSQACRWLQACLFGFNILLAGLLLKRYARSALIPIAGACAVLISVPVFLSHASALSEPMFIFFMLLWLLFFMDYIEAPDNSSFILCTMALMAACLTRWVGVTLVLTSVAGIFIFKKESVKTRCINAAVLMIASLLPLLFWMARNALVTGKAINRGQISFHPQALADYNIFNKFTFFNIHTAFFSGTEGLMLIAVMFCMGMALWSKRDKEGLADVPDRAVIFISVLFCFCLAYYIVLILAMTFIDVFTSSSRLFLPLDMAWILLAALLLDILLASNKKHKFLKLVFIILCSFVAAANLFDAPQRILQGYCSAVGSDSIYDDLKIMAEVKKIPSDKRLYTNDSNALYFFAKRDSLEFIPKYEKTTKPDSVYSIFMAKMKDDLRTHKAVLVYFDPLDPGQWLPSLNDIQQEIPLKAVAGDSNEAIYVWDDNV